jgi:protein LTV1
LRGQKRREEAGCRMKQLVDDSAKERALTRQQLLREREVQRNFMMQDSVDSDMEIIVKEKVDKWDCESVLSTLYNHTRPHQIKTGIPKDMLGMGRGLTTGALKLLDMETGMPEDNMLYETLEEEKVRKVRLKQVRKDRTEEKKANTLAFKSEKNRQDKININMKNSI